MNYIFMAIFVAIYLIGVVSIVYQIYKITIIDAKARNLKHPKLMGLLATSGKSSEGLIIYLLKRRKYPIKNISSSEQQEIVRRKKNSISRYNIYGYRCNRFCICITTYNLD